VTEYVWFDGTTVAKAAKLVIVRLVRECADVAGLKT
jgi:hypothetical protein